MNLQCKFKLQIKNTLAFQCAVRDGVNGWAYIWQPPQTTNPCKNCRYYKNGSPLIINKELKPDDFFRVAGKRIRESDWNMLIE